MPVVVFCIFYIAGNQYQTESKHHETFCGFLLTKRIPVGQRIRGSPRGAQPTCARLGAQARPGGLCPPRLPPGLPLYSINTPIFQKPYGGRRKSIPATASSRNTRSNLNTIIEGFIMSIGASPMMRE